MIRPSERTATIAAMIAILIVWPLLQVMAAGVGLSGPDQQLSLGQGQSASSYIVVWNEGDDVETFSVTLSGEVSSLLQALPGSITIPAGGSAKVDLEYQIPSNQPVGTYAGWISVSVSGLQISPTASREVSLTVTEASSSALQLKEGLNLVTWLGGSGTLDTLVQERGGLYKVWRRASDGGYVYVQYYEDIGGWWSSDSSFTGLESGRAYFFESASDCILSIQSGSVPSSTSLTSGLNLVGWCYESMSFEEAFPQGPSDYFVDKVWKRTTDGAYIFAQYYSEADVWWSSDAGFTGLERGCAYFVEVLEDAEISP